MEKELINFFIPLVVFFINILGIWLAYLVLSRSKEKKLSFLFSGMVFLSFIWVDFAYLSRVVNPTLGLRYIRFAWAITPLFFSVIYAFIVTFFKKSSYKNNLGKILIAIGLINIPFVFSSRYVIRNIYFNAKKVLEIDYGPLAILFFVEVTILTILSYYVLLKDYKSISEEEKLKTQYILVGFTFFFLMNAIFNIIFPFFFKVFNLYELGDYSTFVLLLFLAITIIKHKLFGIEIAMVEVFVGIMAVLLFLDIFNRKGFMEISLRGVSFVAFIVLGYFLVENMKKNILQQKELEIAYKKVKKAYKDLQGLDKAKTEFLHIVSHQLRTPLTVLRGYLNFWSTGKIKKLPKKRQKEIKEYIVISANRLHKIIKDMLEIVDLEGGRMVAKKQLLDVKELIEAIYKGGLKGSFETKKLYFKIESKIKGPLKIYSDPRFLNIVFQNLLENAYKYTLKGGVKVIFEKEGEFLKVVVKDTGIGLTIEDKERLFGKFIRGERAKSVEPNGTGLGLYATKKIIEMLNGKIEIDSEGANKGTEVTVWLPFK